MAWRLAKSLEALRKQVNRASPNRSKASDGTIGDTAHSNRKSDHNPNRDGVVTAIDITHDPAHGVNIQTLADELVASRDDRIKYIICNGRIVSGSGQKKPAWVWRSYGGSNPHNKHVHVSVKGSKAAYDSTAPWNFDLKVSPGQAVQPKAPNTTPLLKRGSRGADVQRLQRLLGIQADGVFGPGTEAAVKAFQTAQGMVADGMAGPYTWEMLAKRPQQPAQRAPATPSPKTPQKTKPAPTGKSGGKTTIVGLLVAAVAAYLAWAWSAVIGLFCSIPIISTLCGG